MLSIIIPAFNEENNIENTLKNIKKASKYLKINYEIIFINDSSTDGTKKKILDLKKKNKFIKLYNNKRNLGFGASFKKGLTKCKGFYVLMIQGDNAWSSKMLKKLFLLIDKNKNDLIVQINSKMLSERGLIRWIISKIFTHLLNYFTNKKILYHNGLQIHKRETIKKIKINENHYCFQAEVLLKSLKHYNNIRYIDLQSQARDYGISKAFKIKNIFSTLIFILNSKKL